MVNSVRRATYTASRRALLFVLAVTMTSLLLVLGPKRAFADTGGYTWWDASYVDANYDWGYGTCPSSDTGCDAIVVSGYGVADPWVYYLRNCTSYAAWKINDIFSVSNISGWGNAASWNTGAASSGYTVYSPSSYTPQVGDLAQWGSEVGGGYGHVAYVYAVNSGIANLDEYNVAGTGTFTSNRTTASSSAGTPDHYIHIGDLSGGGGGSPTTNTVSGSGTFVDPSNSEVYAFNIGTDGNMYDKTHTSSGWGSWQSIGNPGSGVTLTGSPNTLIDSNNSEIYAFATGSNGNMYDKTHTSSGWGSWQSIGNPGSGVTLTGSPSTFVDPSNSQVYVFGIGSNGQMYDKSHTSGGWGSWQNISNPGVSFTGSPSAFIDSNSSELYAFAIGSDGNMYDKTHTSSGWGSWQNESNPGSGVTFTGSPSTFVDPSNSEVYAFAIGSDGNMYDKTHTSSGWGSWQNESNPGVSFTGSPNTFIDPHDSEVYAFAIGSNGNMYDKTHTAGSGWGSWQSIGNPGSGVTLTGSPSTFVDPNYSEVYAFAIGSNGNMYNKSHTTAGGWTSSWQNESNPGVSLRSW